MAHNSDINNVDQDINANSETITLDIGSDDKIMLPEGHFIGDSYISRDGQDLVLSFSDDTSYSVPNYFMSEGNLLIEDSSGGVLTEGLANSFMQSSPEYAQNGSMADVSPVGAVEELKGDAFVTRVDGTNEPVTLGTPIYEGDVIQTSGNGAVNVLFMDETTLAVSEDARVAIDNYSYDATTESGETDISVLRGVFVYTSGLIGRDDPDDVEINTPVGSIGIRGTIIAGNINPEGQSEITVLEGAIVIKNGAGERTLSQQFETVELTGFQNEIEYKGVEAANDIGKTYGSVSDVLPKLFSSIKDASSEESTIEATEEEDVIEEEIEAIEETSEESDAALEVEEGVEEIFALDGVEQNIDIRTGLLNENSEGTRDPLLARMMDSRDTFRTELFQERREFLEENAEGIFGIFQPIFEQSEVGTVVGSFVVAGYGPGTTLTFENGTTTNPVFTIHEISTNRYEVRLNTNQGAAVLGSEVDLGTIHLTARDGDGVVLGERIKLTNFIEDAVVNLGDNSSGFNYRDVGASSTTVLGDNQVNVLNFDGDGDIHSNPNNTDFAFLDNNNGFVNVRNTPSTNTLFKESENNYDSLSSAGDLNNDGYSDLIAGEENFSTFELNSGTVSLIYGQEYTATPSIINDLNPTTVTLNNPSPTAGDLFGNDVAGIGDFNGDGNSDFVVGAVDNTNSGIASGAAFIYDGSLSQLGRVNGNPIAGALDNFGKYVEGIGDFDGDGLSDVLVGSDNGATVIFGNDTSFGTIDTLNLGPKGFNVTENNILVGGAAGDINGDGYDDFAVSYIEGADVNTYVVYGNDSSANINLSYLENPDNALKINHAGAATGAFTNGYEITSRGDVDGDGFDDLQLGVDNGEQFLLFGKAGGAIHAIITDNHVGENASLSDANTDEGIITANGNYRSLVGNVDFDDNAKIGLRMSGGNAENNNFKINTTVGSEGIYGGGEARFASIDGGDGTSDTIEFMSAGQSINFSNVNYEQIEQIEVLKFAGDGQSITLTTENIFNFFKTSDTASLRIDDYDGFNGALDQITLEIDMAGPGSTIEEALDQPSGNTGATTYEGTEAIEGDTYHTYKVGGYDLYIDTDITVSIV